MDKLLLTKCLHCRGAMVNDKFYGSHAGYKKGPAGNIIKGESK
jgi:hypothetical protein